MATDISLHNYLKKLNQLLEENRYPEVVLHAQHILKHFSRHVPTYLLLGQALLEQQDFSGAIDLLQRVLSARPNEFVAHLGLSIAYSEEGLYPQAMWHLLRANEMDPYNTNIQRELRELYRQQRGEYLPEIPISQASLARLHFKGGQYPQAIAALRQSLAEADEDRVDLELLLAESLWRNKQRIEAAEICDGILKKLPNCIMANAILAEIYLQGEQPNQATEHLQLVQTLTQIDQAQLDVSTAVGAAFSVPTATTLPQEIRLPQLEENGLNGTFGMGEDDSTPTIADWISDFGLDEDINREDDLYDWLHPADKTTEETAVTEPEPSWLEDNLENELEPIQLAPDQLDEWNISPTDETVFAAPAAETVDETEDIPGWLQNISPTQSPDAEAVHEEGVPDWLQPSSANDNADFVANLNEQFDVMEDSVTDNNKGKKPKKVADDAQENSMDDALSWLDDLIGQDTADSTETQAPKAASPQEEALPDWLKDLSTKQAEPDAIPNDDLPDWLKEAALTTETALPGVLDADDLSETTTPSMGDDSGLNEVVEAEIAPIDTDLSWLDELTTESAEHDDLITMTWQDEPESEPAADAEAEPQSFDEAMAWLEDLAAEQSTPIEEPPTVAQGLFGTEILKPETAVSEPANSELDEAMAWLDELASEEPEATLADATREATNQALETDVAAASPQDTMTWLDELAANQEALIEENAEAPIDNNLADALDWLEAQTEETTPESGNEAMTEALDFELETPTVSVQRPLEMPEDPDEALAWLEQLAADTYQTDSVSTETTVSGVVETAVSDTEPAIEELETVPSTTEASLLDVPEDPDEAMAWLEQLAANQGAPLDELPSLQASATLENEPDANEAVEPADDLDDAMAWLEELTQDQDNVQETLEGAAPIAAVESIAENMAEAADVAEEEQLDGIDLHAVPEDPDEAMAWLEQLAARQGAPIDELPSLHETSEETAVEAVDSPAVDEPAAAETDNDLDGDPMAWLEELMQDEDILAEEAGTLEDIPDFLADAEQENETVAPTVEETETVDLEAADVSEPPEDLDDAMAWLEQLAANQGASLDELPSLQDTPEVGEETAVVAEVAPEAPVEEIEATESENAEVSEPPEDLDDAMAWLEQLAADQGASLDELPSLQDAPEVGEETAVVAGMSEAPRTQQAMPSRFGRPNPIAFV
ncbi:MAG: tetratricopeptide repeat protein, partial [Chloroflexota bacterium]